MKKYSITSILIIVTAVLSSPVFASVVFVPQHTDLSDSSCEKASVCEIKCVHKTDKNTDDNRVHIESISNIHNMPSIYTYNSNTDTDYPRNEILNGCQDNFIDSISNRFDYTCNFHQPNTYYYTRSSYFHGIHSFIDYLHYFETLHRYSFDNGQTGTQTSTPEPASLLIIGAGCLFVRIGKK